MEKSILMLAIGVFGACFLYWLQGSIKRRRMVRKSQANFEARYLQYGRPLPLSREDKRGWATGADGVIRPR